MYLTDCEKKMRDGHLGEAVRMAMSILVELGETIGAPAMVEITHVHTDSGFYLGDAGLEFVEHLAALGGHVAVPTSLNNTSWKRVGCRTPGSAGTGQTRYSSGCHDQYRNRPAAGGRPYH